MYVNRNNAGAPKRPFAQSRAWSLAKTLRVCIALFESDGGYCVLPSDEFDGDPATVLFEYDPFAR